MDYFYSPHTGEHIDTANPAPWMARTTIKPPAYDPAAAGAFFREGAWVIEQPNGPEAPRVVTMRQARLALFRQGLLSTVTDTLALMPGQEGEEARIEWEFSSMVERDRPLVQSLAIGLGLTEQQLDDLFALAASL